MLLLTSTSDALQVVTGSAGSISVHASYMDYTAPSTVTPGRQNTADIVTAATTTVVSSPGASVSRNVKRLSIRNKSTTITNLVTVRHTDGTIVPELDQVQLLPGYRLLYTNDVVEVRDASGNLLVTSGLRKVASVYDAQADFGFVGDLVTTFDGACSSGAPTKITSVTAGFTANAKVGHRITLAGAGAAGAQYTGTITVVDSNTQVTVSPNITTTVSAKGLSFGTDNTTAIATMVGAVNNATFPGARIFFGQSPTNAYGFPTRVVFNKTCQLEGIGGGHTADTGDYTRIGGTRLAWWGTDSDSAVNFSAFIEFVPTGVQSLKRVSLSNLWLDCRNGDQNEALIGLRLVSCHGFNLAGFFIMDALAIALQTNISSSPTEAQDTTRFSIRDFCVRALDNPQAGAMTTPILMTSAVALTTTPQSLTVAANTLPASGYAWVETTRGYPVLLRYTGGGGTTTLTGCVVTAEDVVNTPTSVNGGNVVQAVPGNSCCVWLNGATTANTCCGMGWMWQLSHGTTWGPAAFELLNSDSIDFLHVVINGGSNTNDGAINRIRKPGVRLNSGLSATLAARNNSFRGGSAGAGGVSAMGVSNAGALLWSATPNYWDLYELGNGEPVPTVETGCYFSWTPNGGFAEGDHGPASVADQAITAATLTLITGSLLPVPFQGWQVGTKIRWKLRCSKTAAGVAVRNFFIRVGTLGTTGDAIIATLLQISVPTANIDTADIEVELSVRGPLGAACAGVAHLRLLHQLNATGFLSQASETIVGTMATWNSTTQGQFVHLSLTTGAAEAITVQSCGVEVVNAANP